MIKKNRSYRWDLDVDPVSIYNQQHLATFEAQFIKTLSSTETELKNYVSYKKQSV